MTRKREAPRVEVVDDEPQNGGQQAFHAYAITTSFETHLGFDPRPMNEVEAEWLSKWRASAERLERASRAAREAEIAGHADDDDKPHCPGPEEILRLTGIPGLEGLGSLRVVAADVRGIAHASPGAVVEWMEGAGALLEMFGVRKKGKRWRA